MHYVDILEVKTVAVIGAGTIGASWAAWFLARGFAVIVSDPEAAAERQTREALRSAWPQLVALGVTRDDLAEALGRLTFRTDAAQACEQADFVQENAPERLVVKQELLARIDEALPQGRIIASSTSGLRPSDMQARMRHPGRLVVAHPFNPPHLIPLVEIVGGQYSDEAAAQWALAFYTHHGKSAVRLRREIPGHIANRLQAALWREAAHLVKTGVASVRDVDIAITEGPGLRWALMGPHLTFHLAGGDGGIRHFADHIGPAMEVWWRDLGQDETIGRGLVEQLEKGIADEVGPLLPARIAQERDRLLLELLLARQSGNRLW